MEFVNIVNTVIDQQECERLCATPKAGAIACFLGVTRDNHNGRSVLKLEYECYEQMARSEMRKICSEIRSKWPDVTGVCLVHRIGHVPIGEASVVVVVSSPHRRDALRAVEYGIDEIKARVPIWKKEFYSDGQHTWKENSECCFHGKN